LANTLGGRLRRSPTEISRAVAPAKLCRGMAEASAHAPKLLAVSTQRANPGDEKHHELSVEELVRRAKPLPPPEQMAIDDLSDEEGAAFLAAVRS